MPFSYVYAGELTMPAILEGIRQGRVIISSGPWLSLEAAAADGSARAGIGDTLRSNSGQAVLEVGWKDAPAEARLVVRGRVGEILSREVSGAGSIRCRLAVEDEERAWVELYGGDGALVAMTNAVYLTNPG